MITLEPMQIESYKIEERAKAIVVNDAVSYDNTVLFLKEIAQKKKDFKAQRDKYVKPMKDSIKAIDEKLQEPIKLWKRWKRSFVKRLIITLRKLIVESKNALP